MDLLDDYDHQRIQKPEGSGTVYHLTYEECRQMISAMHFSGESSLFGNEKDESDGQSGDEVFGLNIDICFL